jgi:hypothetical protein
MPIKKEYSKDKEICQVTFTISKEMSKNFKEIYLVGDFNNWDPHQHKFSPNQSDDSSSIVLVLEAGKEFQFRYLCDGQIWLNEPEADKQVLTHYKDSKNSVLIV